MSREASSTARLFWRGLPTARYKQGYVWVRDPADDHPYCHLYFINIIQDYSGGGTYGASYAKSVGDGVLRRKLMKHQKGDSHVTRTHKITCPSCQTLNQESAIFCRKCGAPIGATATLDPMQTISAQGFLFCKATEGRPRPIVLLGIWILFLPMLVVGIYFAIHLILNRSGFSDFFFFWGAIGLAYIGFKVLYRITKNYLTLPKKNP